MLTINRQVSHLQKHLSVQIIDITSLEAKTVNYSSGMQRDEVVRTVDNTTELSVALETHKIAKLDRSTV
jgi:hypothetical protein